MLEHVAADRVDHTPLAVLVQHRDHAGLLLIALGPFVVEIVQVERNSGAKSERLNGSHLIYSPSVVKSLGLSGVFVSASSAPSSGAATVSASRGSTHVP